MRKKFCLKNLFLLGFIALFLVFGPIGVFGQEAKEDLKEEIKNVEVSEDEKLTSLKAPIELEKENKEVKNPEKNENTEAKEALKDDKEKEELKENSSGEKSNEPETDTSNEGEEKSSVSDDEDSKKDEEIKPESDEKKSDNEIKKNEDTKNDKDSENKEASEDTVKVDDAKKDNGEVKNEGENKFDISIISDTHVLPESMQGKEDNKDFTNAKNSDRKLFVESTGLLDSAINIIEEKGSQILIISGDLTKDGEKLSHEYLAQKLKEWQEKKPGRSVIVVPGNHDIYNHNAYDFSSGERVEAERTSPDDFINIYGDLVYKNSETISQYRDSDIYKAYLAAVNEKYKREEEYKNFAHGYTSYVKRYDNKYEDRNGLTIIGLDTAIYTIESTKNHKDGYQETDGSVTLEQMKWMVDEVRKAQAKNDIVAVVCHHAFLPHFKNQEKFLNPYIVHEWDTKFKDDDEAINGKTPSEILADLGVKFLFTGHLHAHDIAHTKTAKGNDFFDIQTGSTVTYPLPVRHVTFVNNFDKDQPGFDAHITSELIKKFEYKDPDTGEMVTVDNATQYSHKNSLTAELVSNLAMYYLDEYDLNNFNSKKLIFGLLKDKGIDLPENGYGDAVLNIVAGLLGKKEIETGNNMVSKVTIEVKDIENKEKYGEGRKIAIDVESAFGKAPLMIRPERLEGAIDSILEQVDTKIVTRENVRGWLYRIIDKMMQTPVGQENGQVKTLKDLANDSYNSYLRGDEEQAPYIKEVVEKYSKKENDLTADILKYSKDTIDQVFEEITSKIAYKIPDEKLPEDLRKLKANDEAKFVKYLIESEDPDNGAANFIIGFAPAITGKNVNDTLSKEMVAGLIYKDKKKHEKVEGSFIVNKLLGLGPVKDMLNSLAKKLGGDTINQAAISVVNGMTDENAAGYNYKFLPDSKGEFSYIYSSDVKDGASFNEKDGKFELSGDIAKDYKIEKVDILVDGKVVKTLKGTDNITDQIKALDPKGEVQVNLTLTNAYGNTFLMTSKATYKKANPTNPVNPSNPEQPENPTDPVEPVKPGENDNKVTETLKGGSSSNIVSRVSEKEIILQAPQVAKAGESIFAKVKNAKANTTYALYLDENKISDVKTDNLGQASVLVKIPENSSKDKYVLSLRDMNGNILAKQSINVLRAQAA